MNKKGSILDLFLVIIIVFALAFTTIMGYKIFDSVNNNLQDSDSIDANSKALTQDNKDSYASLFDGLFLFAFIGLGIALFISAFFLNAHPVFYFFALILLSLVVFVAGIMGNTYEAISSSDSLSDATSQFTFIPFVMDNFVNFIVGLGFLLIIGLYAKSRMGEGY